MHDMMSVQDNDSEEFQESPSGRMYRLPCRICLSEMNEQENPLISPCICAGTMKYIHIKCLQQFLRSKLANRSTDSTISFAWKKLGCDLCKKPYPYKFVLGGKVIELLEIPKPPGQYLIVECLCRDINSHKGLHVISFLNNKSVKIGRGQDCEIRANDISVSRFHASIKYVGGRFYLEDQGGKYGTLIQVKRPIVLDPNLTFQSGRSLFKFSLKKSWSLIPACFRSVDTEINPLFKPLPMGHLPLLPINTHISVSISDPYELLAKAGLTDSLPEEYQRQGNLLFEHKQLGLNSSCEEDKEIEDKNSIEEVEMAELSDEEFQAEMTNRFETEL